MVPTSDVTSPGYALRLATADDREALVAALLAAINWSPHRPPLDRGAVLADPAVNHYVVGWPRAGDLGVVAVTATVTGAGPVAGAAWLRVFPPDDPGYGYVAAGVPELSIGVEAAHRGQGVGRQLLRTLLDAARARGVPRVALSVERANRARGLYLSEGFTVVARGPDADTMVSELPA